MADPEIRVYPYCCTSACCGKVECPPKCPNLPTLNEFKAWVEERAAKVTDPTWCPNVYEATR